MTLLTLHDAPPLFPGLESRIGATEDGLQQTAARGYAIIRGFALSSEQHSRTPGPSRKSQTTNHARYKECLAALTEARDGRSEVEYHINSDTLDTDRLCDDTHAVSGFLCILRRQLKTFHQALPGAHSSVYLLGHEKADDARRQNVQAGTLMVQMAEATQPWDRAASVPRETQAESTHTAGLDVREETQDDGSRGAKRPKAKRRKRVKTGVHAQAMLLEITAEEQGGGETEVCDQAEMRDQQITIVEHASDYNFAPCVRGEDVQGSSNSSERVHAPLEEGPEGTAELTETDAGDRHLVIPEQSIAEEAADHETKRSLREAKKLKSQRRRANRANRIEAESVKQLENGVKELLLPVTSVAHDDRVIPARHAEEVHSAVSCPDDIEPDPACTPWQCDSVPSRPHSRTGSLTPPPRRPLTIREIIACERESGEDEQYEQWEWMPRYPKFAADAEPQPLWAWYPGSRSDNGITGASGFGSNPF